MTDILTDSQKRQYKVWINSSQRWGHLNDPDPFLAGGDLQWYRPRMVACPSPRSRQLFSWSFPTATLGLLLSLRETGFSAFPSGLKLLFHWEERAEDPGSSLPCPQHCGCSASGLDHREALCGLLPCPQSFSWTSVEIRGEEPANG